ncbi:hypothetical protein PR048_019665 [Dryococelus australis]|uniref:Reverse transcriptase domain-containing protein n=1 Tax=Dryococelus australis TaxID=614101 RepID=A0ABQ9H436_9NEOP|nr:hypothetical protein PR048_019665 [Dryococelus australis]
MHVTPVLYQEDDDKRPQVIVLWRYVDRHTYADEVVLIGKNKEKLRETMKVLVKEIKEVGLEINIEKTKYLPISRRHNVGHRALDMDGVALEKIDFKYLGGLLNERNIMEMEILTRIQVRNRYNFSKGKILKSKLVSRTSKLRIYKTIIQPVVLYGAKLWTLTKRIENKLMAFENGILRQICGPVKEGEIGEEEKIEN